MRHITYKEVTQKVTDKVTEICDFCKKEIKCGHYDVLEATIECRIGHHYPEGGDFTKYDIDICTDCFIDKVKPWIESQGIEFRKEETYY